MSPSQDIPRAAEGEPRERAGPWAGGVVLLIALAPALAAMASVPWFVTQDGPAHFYNAEILARSFDVDSPFGSWYRVRWEPLPNWVGHLMLVGLRAVAPVRLANLAINALTLVGFAASVLWLRWAVVGHRGLGVAALLAALLGLNVSWLFGFTSFLLGACLFPLTLGAWWAGRERLDGRRVAALSLLLVLGYFGHLVSLGLTVIGLAVLALLTPCGDGRRAWAGRLGRTALSTLPLVPLGLLYLNLTRRGGGMRPEWGHLADPFSLRSWVAQLGWADPISIASKSVLPFGTASTRGVLLAPAAWLVIALGLALSATLRARASDPDRVPSGRRGWAALAALLILGGLASPDTLGASHGGYLPQRIVLLGLAALVPVLDLDPRRRAVQGCAAALVVALAVQSAFVWDYAQVSQRTAGTFWQARAAVGRGQRVATLVVRLRERFRANPLLHADCLLGVETGNILWNNYETLYYYFPVQFREGLDQHPDARELERLTLQDDPSDAGSRAESWERLLRRDHASIDVLVVWGSEPRLDAITARWFRPESANGPLRILRHR